jgi:hypothetical protein
MPISREGTAGKETHPFSLVAFLVNDGHSDQLHEQYQVRYLDLGSAGGKLLWLRDVGHPGVMDGIAESVFGATGRQTIETHEAAVQAAGGECAYRRKRIEELRHELEEIGARRTPASLVLLSVEEPSLSSILPIPRAVLFDPETADTFWRRLEEACLEENLLKVDPSGKFASKRSMSSLQSYLRRMCGVTLTPGATHQTVVQPVEAPSEATWEDVCFTVMDSGLRIEAGDESKLYDPQTAGLCRRSPGRLWGLLRLFALEGGKLSRSAGGPLDRNARNNLKQYMCELRHAVRRLVPGIDGNPIAYDRGQQCYRTRFHISTEEGLRFPTPEQTRWADVGITRTGPSSIRVSVARKERYAAYKRVTGQTHSEREVAEREGEEARTYSLRALHLIDDQGRNSASGEALLALLDGGGQIDRPQDDEAMLELCGVLTRLMGLKETAFEIKGRLWVANFDAESEVAR